MSILSDRYASDTMRFIFSPETKAKLWRRLWYDLASVQKELGIQITDEQIRELEKYKDHIDLYRIKEIETELKHDVMAHLKAFAQDVPIAAPILHLGATSCFITDNADTILYQTALMQIKQRLTVVIDALADKAREWINIPCLGYTHFQAAQPTTLGKRLCLWMQDLIDDYWSLHNYVNKMQCRGAKGTTGTQASFLELFDGDSNKVEELDHRLAARFGFNSPIPLSGQTLPRRLEAKMADLMAGIAVSLCKLGTDLRLLSHTGELREGFGQKQVGSSAMPYKRNPMKAERLCSLSRAIVKYRDMMTDTAMNQWLERSLDDSAIRRIALPDQFMAVDGALLVARNLIKGLEPNLDVLNERLNSEGPFLAVEKLLIRGVKQGHNRQELHEKLKNFAMTAKELSPEPGDYFMRLIETDEDLNLDLSGFSWDPAEMTGLASHQVETFLKEKYTPIHLSQLTEELDESAG